MRGVLLITMPFDSCGHPSIGLSLLKAALVRDGLPCELRYLNLRFAERIGGARYERIAASRASALVTECIFAADLFGDQTPPLDVDFAEILPRPGDESVEDQWSNPFGPEGAPELLAVRAEVGAFLDQCLAAIPWEAYALVGLTTTFQQNTASLALARRLKERYPHLAIAFGGANCEGEMGRALHRLFPFVDYVCSGEGDLAFPVLARRILQGRPVGDIPGIIRRVNGRTVAPQVASAPVMDLDALPVPDYDDYVAQLAAMDLELEHEPRLLIETARGCWWGQKSHCTFCGLNDATIQFRAKSPERAIAEFRALAERYRTPFIAAVDNIIDLRYYRDVLPRLADLQLEVELFYETKSNLRKDQVRLLRESGVTHIQPGIESLSTNVLRFMRKGVTALHNIQLLRWCAEYLVWPFWNLLAGFPGEEPADYARQAEIVPLLTHLPPPSGVSLVRLDRFSPLFVNAAAMGVRNVRAARGYRYVYPFSAEELFSLAYYFDFDFADGRDPASYLSELRQQVSLWTSPVNRAQLVSLVDGDTLVICDTRPVAVREEHHLRGLRRAVYEYCDHAHTRAEIVAHLAALPIEQTHDGDLDAVLGELVAARLMLREDRCYLSLAVAGDYQVEWLAECYAQRSPLPASLRPAAARIFDRRTPALSALFAAKLVSCSVALPWPLISSPEADRAPHAGPVERAE